MVIGVFAVTWSEVSLTTVAGLLTVMGYSVNDTVIVFDRIRENQAKLKDKKIERIIDISINEMLVRTILTSSTVFATGVDFVARSPGHRLPTSATTAARVEVAAKGEDGTVRDHDDVIRLILTSCDHLTVVGCSRDEWKEAHAVPARMQRHGYRITPINPHAEEILGERAYPTLVDAPRPVDIVQVFRPSADATDVVRQAVDVGASAVWLQQGIRSPEGRELCRERGLLYVEDHCMAVDYIRLNIAALRPTAYQR